MKVRICIILLIVSTLSGCLNKFDQKEVLLKGKIIDIRSSDTIIANATITFESADKKILMTTRSNVDGIFSLKLHSSMIESMDYALLNISADGFRSREIKCPISNLQMTPVKLSPLGEYHYYQPLQLEDGIATKDIQNIDNLDKLENPNKTSALSLFKTMFNRILIQPKKNANYSNNNKPLNIEPFKEIHSLLVYKDGALIIEEYFNGNADFIDFEGGVTRVKTSEKNQWSRTNKHYVASVNKALTATITGIVLDNYSLDVKAKLSQFLPAEKELFNDSHKSDLSIHHVLSMQLGFEWDEWTNNDLVLLWKSNNFSQFLLTRKNNGPGIQWRYNSAAPNLLLKSLQNIVGEPISKWANQHFYSLLGIDDYVWQSQPDGMAEGSARMFLRPRDMLKIGITYLQGGVWNNQQVIPRNWVKKVFQKQASSEAGDYSYYFWLRELDGVHYISADGDGGQYINIFPEHNMVIVMTQGNYLEWPLYKNQANSIMRDYIFPAFNITE